MTSPAAKARHLLRALLRECTYLPDRRARGFFHDYVISSFRSYQGLLPRIERSKKDKEQLKLLLQRGKNLLDKASKWQKLLSRANCGHHHPLRQVMRYTYGRVGPRRHSLLQELRLADSQDASAALLPRALPEVTAPLAGLADGSTTHSKSE